MVQDSGAERKSLGFHIQTPQTTEVSHPQLETSEVSQPGMAQLTNGNSKQELLWEDRPGKGKMEYFQLEKRAEALLLKTGVTFAVFLTKNSLL